LTTTKRRTPKRRIIKPAETRRRELLEAAARLFAERGFQAVTVADIADAAHLAKGSFYLHFSSKEDLVGALRHSFSEGVVEAVTALALPATPAEWPAFTEHFVRASIAAQVDAQAAHELLRQLPHRHGESSHSAGVEDPARAELRRIIEAGVGASAYHVADVDETTSLLYELLHAAGDRACANPQDQSRVTQAAIEVVTRTLLA
jgi:AcrR family transcriptional regulator